MGSVDVLIVWENLDIMRYALKNHTTDGKCIYCCYWKFLLSDLQPIELGKLKATNKQHVLMNTNGNDKEP